MSQHKPYYSNSGVLATEQVQDLINKGFIAGRTRNNPKPGASAFDLTIGNKAWKLEEGQRPTTRELGKIKSLAKPLVPLSDSHGEYFEFAAGGIYLIELDPYLELPPNISGRATGKSSVGRLDVITRLIANSCREYDVVPAGYGGDLHLLLMPQTFTIRVDTRGSVNQLRLFSGPQNVGILTRDMLRHYPLWHVLNAEADAYETWDNLVTEPKLTDDPLLCDLTVDLGDVECPYIFKARPGVNTALDLREAAYQAEEGGGFDPAKFFEKIPIDSKGADRFVILETKGFYIMKSRERLRIPNDVAVEVVAISERIGDIRIHYAGFAHAGFGCDPDSTKLGAPLIFEVRATDMTTKLYHSSVLARIQLFRMSMKTEPDKSPYDKQELKLSKIFRAWDGGS